MTTATLPAPILSLWRHPIAGGITRATGAFALLIAALRIVFASNPPPAGVVAFGVVVGLLYSFISFGLILVYRANRIINFAGAEIGATGAVLCVLLMRHHDVPYLVALPLAMVIGALTGWVVQVTVISRFANASRLVVSVASIGVALVLSALQLFLPFWFEPAKKAVAGDLQVTTTAGETIARTSSPIPSPFSGLRFRIEPLTFDGNAIVIVVAALLVVVGLVAFFKLTDVGLSVRGAAENRDRALLLGVKVARVNGVVWLLAGALAALGVFLRVPVTGIPLGSVLGPSVLLYALAASVIGRMESFGVALVACVALGITEQAIYFSTRDPDVGLAIALPVLLVAMLARRDTLSRGQDTGTSTWQLARVYRFIPFELRALPEVRWATVGLGATVVAGLIGLPLVLGTTQQTLLSVVVCYGIVVVSLVVLTGWAGQISLGQWGFAGIGAAVAGGMATHLHADFFVTLVGAGLAGAALALLIGLPALRIQGLFLAVTTLAFAMAVQVYVLSPHFSAWLLPPPGTFLERPVLFDRFSLASGRAYYYFTLIVLALALLSVRSLRRSRAGRILLAVRDNERGAQAYGLSVRRAKLWGFAISGFWAAIAGALFVYHQGSIDAPSFGPDRSLTLLVVSVIGGSTSLPGAFLGTTYFGVLTYGGLSNGLKLLASGLGALLLLLFLPGGLAQVYYSIRDKALRRVAERRGLVVPSLVADLRTEQASSDGGLDESHVILDAAATVDQHEALLETSA